VAYGAFLIAKKAHMDIRFADAAYTLPDADVYMLPSIKGTSSIPRHTYMDIIERVKNGATLYMSLDDCLLSPFDKVTGMRVDTRCRALDADKLTIGDAEFTIKAPYRIRSTGVGAVELAYNDKGDPVFSEYTLGKGKVYCLYYPIEYIAATEPGVTDGECNQPFEKIYRAMQLRSCMRCAEIDVPTVGLTEHIVSENERILVAVNYEPDDGECMLSLAEGWKIADISSIDDKACIECNKLRIPKNTGAVIRIVH
jgi:hypothetical protein